MAYFKRWILSLGHFSDIFLVRIFYKLGFFITTGFGHDNILFESFWEFYFSIGINFSKFY